MLSSLFALFALALAGVLFYASTRPDTLSVRRDTTIRAAPEQIFGFIQDLQQWQSWSPYEAKDPMMKRSFGAITAGVGATYAWEGNKAVGTGSMEVSGVDAPSRVTIQLHFVKPFEARNQVDFTLEPQAGATLVSWNMKGPAPFMSKLMGVFIDMDRMIGQDFEVGLANLKARVERA